MARKELRTNVGIVAQLKAMVSGKEIKYAVLRELIDMGYVAETDRVLTQNVKEAGRGRKKIVYSATGKGKGLINLSRNWKTKVAA